MFNFRDCAFGPASYLTGQTHIIILIMKLQKLSCLKKKIKKNRELFENEKIKTHVFVLSKMYILKTHDFKGLIVFLNKIHNFIKYLSALIFINYVLKSLFLKLLNQTDPD